MIIPITYEHLRERAKAGFKQLRHEQPEVRTGAGREATTTGLNQSPVWWLDRYEFGVLNDDTIHVYYDTQNEDGDRDNDSRLALGKRIAAVMHGQGLMPVWDGTVNDSITLPPIITIPSRGNHNTLFINLVLQSLSWPKSWGCPDYLQELGKEYSYWTTAGQGWTPEWWKRKWMHPDERGFIERGISYPIPEHHETALLKGKEL